MFETESAVITQAKAITPGDLGKMESTTAGKPICTSASCRSESAVAFAEHKLCLEHYFAWCYRQLDELERKIRGVQINSAENAGLRVQVEDCSNRCLAVSLQHEPLTNQDRSRLLDILLWTGDLLYMLRSPNAGLPDSATFISRRFEPQGSRPSTRRS
jgi:hypothetical protein